MNILTKISVLVLVFLVLVACPIFITQASVPAVYRDLYVKEQLRSRSFAQSYEAAKLLADLRTKERDETLARVTDLQRQLAEAANTANADLSKLRGDLARLENEKSQIGADLTRVSAVLETEQKRTAGLSVDLKSALEQINTLNKNNLETENLLHETQARADRAELVAKVLREENYRLSEELKTLREQAGIKPEDKTAQQEVPAGERPKISGRIVAIDQGVAQINIGSGSGVKRGMKLMVSRGARFVGNLVIEDVEVNEAVGIVHDKQVEPMQGDEVSTVSQ